MVEGGEELLELLESVAPLSDCNSTDSLIYSYSFETLSETRSFFRDVFLKRSCVNIRTI